ncbi:MAG: hypothetical protein WAN79_12415 [Opitutaceae bacterium]
MKPSGIDPRRGSALLAAMIVITILSVAAAGILSYSLTTYRNSVRQATLDQAKMLADSEMENLYFQWEQLILSRSVTAEQNLQNTYPLGGANGLQASSLPFLTTVNANYPVGQGWSVYRYINFTPVGDYTTGNGSAMGIMPGTVNEIGQNFYFLAETSATLTSPLFGTVTYHSGRHFVYSSTSLFQFAVFYQGNLEMQPGSNTTITGPIATNASAYLGTLPGITLTLASSVYYFEEYNGASDALSGETQSLTGTGYNDPIYNPNPESAPPDQAAERALQVSQLKSQANFLGGVNVQADILNPAYAQAYSDPDGTVDLNNIYRAVIAPPPGPGDGTLYTEDPLVAASRMYNAAGILITVNKDPGTGVISVDVGGRKANGTIDTKMYDTYFSGANAIYTPGTNPSTDVIQAPRTSMVDPREYLNGTTSVAVTTVDISNLNAALTQAMAHSSDLGQNYNGVVYVYDSTPQTGTTLNGILIKNGTTTPFVTDSNGNPLWFTIVSDNGVYVHGDFNTTLQTFGGTSAPNPSSIMGDAVTALSQGWNMAANAGPLPSPMSARQAAPSTGSTDAMTINAAILTGNTPTNTTVTPNIKSGGAQNLVRLDEDWWSPTTNPAGGLVLNINGSLGQLFSSKYFKGPWVGTGGQTGLGGASVYVQPHVRNFTYDTTFQKYKPAGSPTTTGFTRGDFFFW